VGQPTKFTPRANADCAKLTRAISRLDRADTGVTALSYAIDRYTDIERLVAEIATDTGFPGGSTGRQLRQQWVQPAQASLRQGRIDLNTLRAAVRAGDVPAQKSAFAAASIAGSAAVDTTALSGRGLGKCAVAFSASTA
jgi:hypothetical protein